MPDAAPAVPHRPLSVSAAFQSYNPRPTDSLERDVETTPSERSPAMKLGDARVFSVPTFSSDTAPRASTPVDRWALGRIRASVPSARLRFVLWDGFELPSTPGTRRSAPSCSGTAARCSAGCGIPDLNFGEAYMFGAVELHGDLVAMLDARSIARSGDRGRGRWWLWQRSNDERAAQRERPPPLRPRQRVLPALARSRDGLHLRVLSRRRTPRSRTRRSPRWIACAGSCGCRPGERVVEAGCGWGSLALFMARQYGVTVRAFNVSPEQIAYARDRARDEGLGRPRRVRRGRLPQRAGPVRRVRVGRHARARRAWRDYQALGARHRPLARPAAGRGLLHFIGRNQPGAAQPVDPEADLPGRVSAGASRGVRARARAVEPVGARRREPAPALRGDARALAAAVRRPRQTRWRGCSTRRSSAPGGCTWPGSQAAFTTGSMQLFQVLFARGSSNAIPWTRVS